MRANHNFSVDSLWKDKVVSKVPKILKWEQITTDWLSAYSSKSCFQGSKDTKMRANHNPPENLPETVPVVSKVPKILKWEQITTAWGKNLSSCCCFQGSKDTKMRANHNTPPLHYPERLVVSNVSKILKWEQITTISNNTSMFPLLFPMFQRY